MESLKFKHIAMLSTHGYFDPVPQLGRTDTGGQVVYVLELAKALALTGIKVDIYTRWFEKEKPQIDPVPGNPDVRVIRIPAGNWEFLPKEVIYPVLPELAANMISFIRDQGLDYDLFHGHYVDAGIVTVEVAKALKRPAFYTPHSLGAWKREQMGGDPAEMDRKYNFTHRISEEERIHRAVNGLSLTTFVQKEKMETLCDYQTERLEIIPPGVDVHRFTPRLCCCCPPSAELPERYLFNLSRIDTSKGHDMMLYAFDRVRKQIPDIRLLIGGGSPHPKPQEQEVFSRIREIIRAKGMEGQVDVIGYVPDDRLLEYYQNAECFIMPSLFEPFGMTTQEAMACGRTVIASKFGGIRDVIVNGVNGFLVDPANRAEFGETILKVVSDPALREKTGAEACRIIRAEYSWEAIAGRFLTFFRKYYHMD